jgi:hypothetical protein
MSEKIYVGSGVEKFDGDLVEISVCLSDLPKEFMFEYNSKKYIKLKVGKKRKEDEYGKTHYVTVDTYKPKKNEEDDEMPF